MENQETDGSRALMARLPVPFCYMILPRFTAAIRAGATTPAAVVRAVMEQAEAGTERLDAPLLNAIQAHPNDALAFAAYALNRPPRAACGPPSPAQKRTLTKMGLTHPNTSADAVKLITRAKGGWGKGR